jgi:hypothetical protein
VKKKTPSKVGTDMKISGVSIDIKMTRIILHDAIG